MARFSALARLDYVLNKNVEPIREAQRGATSQTSICRTVAPRPDDNAFALARERDIQLRPETTAAAPKGNQAHASLLTIGYQYDGFNRDYYSHSFTAVGDYPPLVTVTGVSRRGSARRGSSLPPKRCLSFRRISALEICFELVVQRGLGRRGRRGFLRVVRPATECAAMKSPTIFDQASITSVSRSRSRKPEALPLEITLLRFVDPEMDLRQRAGKDQRHRRRKTHDR